MHLKRNRQLGRRHTEIKSTTLFSTGMSIYRPKMMGLLQQTNKWQTSKCGLLPMFKRYFFEYASEEEPSVWMRLLRNQVTHIILPMMFSQLTKNSEPTLTDH